MKCRLPILFLLSFAFGGCVENLPVVSPAKKEDLRKLLDGKFLSVSVPKEKENDFYRVLMVYAQLRTADDFVLSASFRSRNAIELLVSDPQRLSYVTEIFKKKRGQWAFAEAHVRTADQFNVESKLPNQASEPTAPSGRGSP